jgi:hypothetical protein
MTKKLSRLDDFISSAEAARILSLKFGRRIDSDYIRKLKNVRSHRAGDHCVLYHRDDILRCVIRQKAVQTTK